MRVNKLFFQYEQKFLLNVDGFYDRYFHIC